MHEIRQTLRSLWRDKAFSGVAVAMLALGIGATTSVFSIVNGVLLEPLAYEDSGRLYVVHEFSPELADKYPRLLVNGRHFHEWRTHCDACESLGAFFFRSANLSEGGTPVQVDSLVVSHDFLPTIGVQPVLGRGFSAGEDSSSGERVVLIGASLWRNRFAGDPAILGRSITLDAGPATIVGILPESFRFEAGSVYRSGRFSSAPSRFDVVEPLRRDYASLYPAGSHNLGVLLRLSEGATPEHAVAQMDALTLELSRENGMAAFARLTPLAESVVGESRQGLWMLLAAVFAVLLIVCVNLSNLVLARSERRGHDAAVRAALGASRARLLSGAMREGFALAAGGGLLGAVLAHWAIDVLRATAPVELPRLHEVAVDERALVCAAVLTLFSAVAASLIPALRLSKAAPHAALQGSRGSRSASQRSGRLRGLLVGFQAALSAVLLVVAGLLAVSFFRLMAVDKGFETQSIVSFRLSLPSSDYPSPEDRLAFSRSFLSALEQEPGILSAGLTSVLPLSGTSWADAAYTPGRKPPHPAVDFHFVSADYLQAIGAPLVRGRHLEKADEGRANVGVVSESLAAMLWPGENPIGKQVRRGFAEDRPMLTVVGVVADIRTTGLVEEAVPTVYEPYWHSAPRRLSFAVRTRSDPAAFASQVSRRLAQIDPALPAGQFRTMSQIVADSASQQRFQAGLATGFAICAALLACLGAYAVVSYTVVRRTNEIGLRLALGAESSSIVSMVLGEGMRPVLGGLAVGLASAAAIGRFIESLLFHVSSNDLVVFAAVAALLLAAALPANYIPARRAARVDPMTALRHD